MKYLSYKYIYIKTNYRRFNRNFGKLLSMAYQLHGVKCRVGKQQKENLKPAPENRMFKMARESKQV